MTRRPPRPDCYDHVRRYYGVPAYIGVSVRLKDGSTGVLVERRPSDHYVDVRVDGSGRIEGPYHPNDVTYLVVAVEPQ